MAAGDLSPDQARYVAKVTADTGLDPTVVRAWVGAESGWGVTKAGHNYLNVGPRETFGSVELAANRASALVRASDRYAGIRAAIPAGPLAQVRAIGESPWGTNAALLTRVHAQLAGQAATVAAGPLSAGAAAAQNVGLSDIPAWINPGAALLGPLLDPLLKKGADIAGDLGLGGVLKPLAQYAFRAGLSLVFTVAGLALIALGLNRLTGVSTKERFSQASGLVGGVGTAAKIAAVA